MTTSFQRALHRTKTKIIFTLNTHLHKTVEFVHSFGAGGARQEEAEHPDPQPALCTGGSQHPAVPSSPGRAGTLLPCLISFGDLHLCLRLQKDNRANRSLSYSVFSTLPLRVREIKRTRCFSRNSILPPKTFSRNYYILDWTSLILWKHGTS